MFIIKSDILLSYFYLLGQLDKKLDETLTDYYTSFYYMCRKVCNKLSENEQPPITNEIVQVETISEERASRCLQRVELLNKVRHDVLRHEKFAEWIMDKCLPSGDLPDWYVPGKHDCELVKAAARYGIQRTEYFFVNDVEFSFKEYLEKYMSHIEDLMRHDNEGLDEAAYNIDPIQYYFQNQAKIQVSFKQYLSKEMANCFGAASKVEDINEVKDEKSIEVDLSKKCKEECDEENDTSKNQLMIDESLNSPKKIIENGDADEKVDDTKTRESPRKKLREALEQKGRE